MERELILTGIGGQGVQLAAQVLARAATLEGRAVMLFGVYSGMMRGGNSDSTLVVADGAVEAPPLISSSWSAIVMHDMFWLPLSGKLRVGGVAVINSSLFEGELDHARYRVFDVPATDLATELGLPMAASMVIAGAYAAVTGLVGVESLVEGMRQSLPPYRQQHAAGNERAIRAGFDAAEQGGSGLAAPAWEAVPA
ncbi:MAG TPA: 2-oxoacid:acceptor oxidoreductase family protein [Acidimicrobiales bacterium]|nr:2-oxoacid:acceptor oxidoreductase family protein [Acidimicrobiales bacterium]